MSPERRELLNFWTDLLLRILLAGAVIFLIIKAIGVLDGIEKRQQQGTLHHEKLIAQADKSLKDHETFLAEHQRMLDRLAR